MILEIWNDFLYRPLFNLLIWLYNNWADQNMGWAIVYLTIILRIVLLPFTIVSERDKIKNMDLSEEMSRIGKEHRNDPVLKKEEVRRALKRRKVRPWAKALVLGIQALVLLLLYQVFIQGITGEKMFNSLYPVIDFPGKINNIFYGFDLGARYDIFWAGLVAVWLILEIYIDYKRRKISLKQADLMYFTLFPLAAFIALWWLPMVKALFILTTLVFSVIISGFMRVFFKPKKVEKKQDKKDKKDDKSK